MIETAKNIAIAALFGLTSGYFDSLGFTHAAKIWPQGQPAWPEVAKSGVGFALGIAAYWLSLKFLDQLGVRSPLVQTLAWFGMVVVGVALAEGSFPKWNRADQAVAAGIVLGLGWLMTRTGQ